MSYSGGSLINQVLSASTTVVPYVGMGVTFCHYSDRHPGTIVSLVHYKSGAKKGQVKGFYVVDDEYTLISGSEQNGSAQYNITPTDPENLPEDAHKILVVARIKNGRSKWETKGGTAISVDGRDKYYDPSF